MFYKASVTKALVVELVVCSDPQRLEQILAEMERLQKREESLAFASRPDQDRLLRAATYSDEWVCVYHNGRLVGALRSWFICGAKVDKTKTRAGLTSISSSVASCIKTTYIH